MKHTRKRILCILAAAAVTACALPQSTPLLRSAVTVSAAESSGTCGENCTWTLDSGGTLRISGEGKMNDYTDDAPVPWKAQRKNIKAAVICDGITYIGKNAFDGCSGLEAVMIPESVTGIGESAFYGCASLESVAVPKGVTQIAKLTFQGCSGLTEIDLPNGITGIGDYAFYGCSGLTACKIPESVTSIGVNAFAFCSKLEKITIPVNVAEIEACVFIDCTGLKTITLLNPQCKIDYDEIKRMVPKTTVIRGYAGSSAQTYAEFFSQTFEEITGPDHSASGTYGENLTWTLDNEGTLTVSGSGAMQSERDTDAGPWLPYREYIKKAVVGEGVTNIGQMAFAFCPVLTSVTLPESVTVIADSAFFQCSALTEIRLPEHVTGIGKNAFLGCGGLTSVSIPEGVTEIGYSAFIQCSSLTEIILPESLTTIGYSAFSKCTGLTAVTIPEHVTRIGDCAFYETSLKTATVLSTDCTFEEADTPYSIFPDGTVLRGFKGSTAETYAKAYHYSFEALGDAPQTPLRGDYNGDKALTIADAVLLARFVAEDAALTDAQTEAIISHAPDYDGDGLAAMPDVRAVLKKCSEA